MNWIASILLAAVAAGCGMSAMPASNECPDVDGCSADDGGSLSDAERADGDPSPVRPVPDSGEDETVSGLDASAEGPDFVDPTPSPVTVINPFPFEPSVSPIFFSPGSSGFYGGFVDQMVLDLLNPYGSLSTESYLERLCLDEGLPASYCRQRYGP